jgi:hypothetical protein
MMKKQNDGYYEIFHEQNLCKLISFIIIFCYRMSKIVRSNPFTTGCFSIQDEM